MIDLPRRCAIAILALAAAFAAQSASGAGCEARSATQRTRLIELYTSEGCSSCPPADAWLRELPAGAGLIPLAFHVDYWDSLGWRDPYSDARFTARQNELAVRAGSTLVYTPEVVLDGRELRAWQRQSIVPDTQPAAATLALRVTGTTELGASVAIDAPTPGPAWRAYLVLVESGLASEVRKGENRGRVLRHDHVVRAFAGPLPLANANATLQPPAGLVAANSAVVAFVQDERSGEIVQAVRVDLGACPLAGR